MRFDVTGPDGLVRGPEEPGFEPPREIEPHHLVVWAGRWYLVARDARERTWHTYRVERTRPRTPVGPPSLPSPSRARTCPDSSCRTRTAGTRRDRGSASDPRLSNSPRPS
ncbi:WYL domain-containing protein [Arsenicicoccus piscis]|uniref:WYL domain-containing protein n=1 Tax=Arsenicicoccus piscis TaxID=673954 RepID=UPI0024E0E4AA|nr:WYL domain-containing protein [Arsenicicoccus piscis]